MPRRVGVVVSGLGCLPPLPPLRDLSQMVDSGAFRVRRRCAGRECLVVGCVVGNRVAQGPAFLGYVDGHCRGLRDHHQPVSIFWQAALEVEEVEANPKAHALKQSPSQAPSQLRRINIDTYVGMGLSNAIALFIIIATAATLHQSGILDIETSAQAAEALRPIAGPLAFLLFSLGIIGTGMLAIPVLAGSAAYAVAE